MLACSTLTANPCNRTLVLFVAHPFDSPLGLKEPQPPDASRGRERGSALPWCPNGGHEVAGASGCSVGRSVGRLSLAGVISVPQWRHMYMALGLLQAFYTGGSLTPGSALLRPHASRSWGAPGGSCTRENNSGSNPAVSLSAVSAARERLLFGLAVQPRRIFTLSYAPTAWRLALGEVCL